MTEVVSDKRARQAGPGRPVLYVLVASLLLVGVYLVSLLGWSSSTTPPNAQPSTAQQSTGSGAASSNSARVPAANPAYPAPAQAPSQTGSTTPSR